MKLVVGLGNPGNQYNFTRHNVGFLALDYFLKVSGEKWSARPKFNAVYYKTKIDGEEVIFIKPQGFYNESGRVVAEFLRYYKIPLTNLLVVCDNFDLEFGKVRVRESGAAGGNNGLRSIDVALSSSDYPRMRVGTGNDELRRKLGDVDFVLAKFTPEEKAKLPEVLGEVYQRISEWVYKN